MIRVRRPLIALMALFPGAITIDRLGLAGTSDQAISSPVYLLALLGVAAPFGIAGLRRASARTSVLASLTVYGLLRIGLNLGASIEGPGLYIALTEAAFVVLAGSLSREIATGLDELAKALGTVAFGESPAIDLEGPVAANEILAEMARGRRHDRPLSVTVISPDVLSLSAAVDTAAAEVSQALRARFVHGKLARVVGRVLRRSDLLFEHRETGRFVILSPETEQDGIQLLVRRLREAADTVSVRLDAGSATFPTEAVTFEELVARAEQDMAQGSTPPLRAVRANGSSA